MDPTKSFDHLDPKLKETYARVMGTDTNGNATNAGQPAADPTQGLSATPTTFDPNPPAATDPNQIGSPLNPGLNSPTSGPNPGTGPTISDPNSMFTTPLNTPVPSEPAADPNSPATSSFFSNPSPATTDPAQPINTPVEPPVTPYVPEGLAGAPAPAVDGSYAQPLPSPSTVNQAHETSPLIKVLYIIGAVVFFAVYTIFWIKVFNLPFLF